MVKCRSVLAGEETDTSVVTGANPVDDAAPSQEAEQASDGGPGQTNRGGELGMAQSHVDEGSSRVRAAELTGEESEDRHEAIFGKGQRLGCGPRKDEAKLLAHPSGNVERRSRLVPGVKHKADCGVRNKLD